MKYKFTVITVVFNAENLIEETISSVISQSIFNDVQFIIIDGKSTDSSSSIISKYLMNIDVYICESDSGIYDAMNKGINRSLGEWIFFLNAGDTFFDNYTLSKLNSKIKDEDEIIYGNINIQYNGVSKTIYPKKLVYINFMMVLCHQAVFIKRNFLDLHKLRFNLKFKLASDYELIFKCYRLGSKFIYIDLDISNYDLTGRTFRNPLNYLKEISCVIDDNNNLYKAFFLNFLMRVYNLKIYLYVFIKKIFNNS